MQPCCIKINDRFLNIMVITIITFGQMYQLIVCHI